MYTIIPSSVVKCKARLQKFVTPFSSVPSALEGLGNSAPRQEFLANELTTEHTEHTEKLFCAS
jgi:hypothetical protein